ncbi:hypothetical protein [Pleomorphomonas sp. JP5]|uniref:hypothetical protein n=1 Tax=Pleomorphomonas sp. JP5 TaxID=2942998 RepID=UPI002042DE00|nr:hypothetical protein [Pleomorphomonas sp. JP5]MCM5557768.1 hypothetical protein [Pleomorphomonas sp. JP5]
MASWRGRGRARRERQHAMARKTKLLSWIAAALVALTTVVAARSLPDRTWPGDLTVTIEISGTAGAGVATSWQAP